MTQGQLIQTNSKMYRKFRAWFEKSSYIGHGIETALWESWQEAAKCK